MQYLGLTKVFKCLFWQQLLGALTPKRTAIFSSGAFIYGMDLGKLTKKKREKKTRIRTTRRGLSQECCVCLAVLA